MSATVYQIKYSEQVVGTFDPAFIEYDCLQNPRPEKREIAHMLCFYDESTWRQQGFEHFGLVSPKFSSKTGISGKAFIDWIETNPGYDVYFINPFPQLSYWHFNVWTQGEFWHPSLTDLANALFAAAGFSIRVEDLPRNTASSLLYCNFWVGNERFWRIYMAFIRKLDGVVNDLDAENRRKLFELAPHYAPAAYFPFIFERLFSTFILLHEEFSCLPYLFGRDDILNRCENDMERFIIREWADMVDNWDAFGRNDAEYRKLFANLQGMLKIYLSVPSQKCDPEPVIGKGMIEKLKHKLGFMFKR